MTIVKNLQKLLTKYIFRSVNKTAMKITTKNEKSYNPAFTSRNKAIRTADLICRKVNKEFPVFSNTRLDAFNKCDSNIQMYRLRNAVSDVVGLLRYICNDIPEQLQAVKLFSCMKTLKSGNCDELAIATYNTLKLNGYKNVRNCWLYAYNPKTKEIKDLDHTVTVINLKLPENYKFHISENSDVKKRELLKPDNTTIIVDTWARFADFASNAFTKYKNTVHLYEKPSENEKILLLPLRENKSFSKTEAFLKYKYPDLLLKNTAANISKEDIAEFNKLGTIDEKYLDMVKYIKQHYLLKSSRKEIDACADKKTNSQTPVAVKVFAYIKKVIDIF